MNIETSQIEEKRIKYVVTEEDIKIEVSKELVEKIASRVPNVDVDEVIMLIATIEKSRILVIAKPHRTTKIKEEKIEAGLIKLLQEYAAENLAELLEEMKYYEIQEVFEYGNPSEILQELL